MARFKKVYYTLRGDGVGKYKCEETVDVMSSSFHHSQQGDKRMRLVLTANYTASGVKRFSCGAQANVGEKGSRVVEMHRYRVDEHWVSGTAVQMLLHKMHVVPRR